MAGVDPVGWSESDAVGADTAEQPIWTGRRGDLGQPASPSQLPDPDRPDDGKDATAARHSRSLLRELPILVIVALIIAMVIKSFVVQAFVIPTGSMQNTLALQDKI